MNLLFETSISNAVTRYERTWTSCKRCDNGLIRGENGVKHCRCKTLYLQNRELLQCGFPYSTVVSKLPPLERTMSDGMLGKLRKYVKSDSIILDKFGILVIVSPSDNGKTQFAMEYVIDKRSKLLKSPKYLNFYDLVEVLRERRISSGVSNNLIAWIHSADFIVLDSITDNYEDRLESDIVWILSNIINAGIPAFFIVNGLYQKMKDLRLFKLFDNPRIKVVR